MNLIVEKTRKNDVSNIHGYGNNNKQACQSSHRLTRIFAAAHESVHDVVDGTRSRQRVSLK
jgi:hypothetical protein